MKGSTRVWVFLALFGLLMCILLVDKTILTLNNGVPALKWESFVELYPSTPDHFTSNGSAVNFSYIPPWSDGKIHGKPMFVQTSVLDFLHMPPKAFVDLKQENLPQLVFITAVSANHFTESMDAIASVQHHFPDHKIVYYDLGLYQRQAEQISKLCKVDLRKADFSKLPAYVQNLGEYRWKPVLIQLSLQEFGAILWMDSSVRIINGSLLPNVLSQARETGIVLFEYTGHSTYAVTMQQMFNYLATDMKMMVRCEQMSAVSLYYNTRDVYEHIVQWYVLCALEPGCMAPPGGQLACSFKHPGNPRGRFEYFADCHRYDQSALNILLLNRFNFQPPRYAFQANGTNFLLVQRSNTNMYKIKQC